MLISAIIRRYNFFLNFFYLGYLAIPTIFLTYIQRSAKKKYKVEKPTYEMFSINDIKVNIHLHIFFTEVHKIQNGCWNKRVFNNWMFSMDNKGWKWTR